MKGKISHIWRVVVAISLIMSLGLVFAAPVAAQPSLALNLTGPASVYVCTSFNITAEVANYGDEVADNVTVMIVDTSPNVSWVCRDAAVVGGVCPGYPKTAEFDFDCEGPGTAEITFVAVAADGTYTMDTIYIEQECQLGVEITIPNDLEEYHVWRCLDGRLFSPRQLDYEPILSYQTIPR